MLNVPMRTFSGTAVGRALLSTSASETSEIVGQKAPHYCANRPRIRHGGSQLAPIGQADRCLTCEHSVYGFSPLSGPLLTTNTQRVQGDESGSLGV
jgi:hypothetical protein